MCEVRPVLCTVASILSCLSSTILVSYSLCWLHYLKYPVKNLENFIICSLKHLFSNFQKRSKWLYRIRAHNIPGPNLTYQSISCHLYISQSFQHCSHLQPHIPHAEELPLHIYYLPSFNGIGDSPVAGSPSPICVLPRRLNL